MASTPLKALIFSLLAVLPLTGPSLRAQSAEIQATVEQVGKTAKPASSAIDIEADELEYTADNQILMGKGNVIVSQGRDRLVADRASLNRRTGDVAAEGNVVLERDGSVWKGDKLKYNFKTRQADTGKFMAFTDPFYIRAEKSERARDGVIWLDGVQVSTCEGERPDFFIRSSSASLDQEMVLRAKNVAFYLYRIPFFWWPYVHRDLDDPTNIDIVPGYSSEMGGFLLTAYTYRMAPNMHGTTRLDYRSKRGVGIGQDFKWENKELGYKGKLQTYYTHDDEPFEDEQEALARADEIDSDRGRVRLSHSQSLTERDYMLAELNWLTDEDVTEDFFEKEYREMPIPENRVSLTHRGDYYTANLLVQKRLNDWHESVDRVPEASVDIQRVPIAGSGLYYEGRQSAVALERVFPEGEEDRDHDTARLDSDNMVLYPTRHFGFLNLIPRAGAQGTYYSNTKSDGEEIVTQLTTNELGAPIEILTTNAVTIEEDGDMRGLVELGLESSFKAFRAFHEDPLWGSYRGLRHVAEPYMNYTFVPEPNITPDQLYQYDEIDELDQRNDIKFGMRNKYQTKAGRNGRIRDLADVDVYTTYLLDPREEQGEGDFGYVVADAELRLVEYMPIDFELKYDPELSQMESMESQISYLSADETRLSLEYRFREETREQVAVEFDLFPLEKWSFLTYWRYDIENSLLQEHEYIIKKKGECVGVGLGYRGILREVEDDEHLVYALLWLTAFPDSIVEMGR